jgi:hypothetical protein
LSSSVEGNRGKLTVKSHPWKGNRKILSVEGNRGKSNRRR